MHGSMRKPTLVVTSQINQDKLSGIGKVTQTQSNRTYDRRCLAKECRASAAGTMVVLGAIAPRLERRPSK
jgi:hypothetical protein